MNSSMDVRRTFNEVPYEQHHIIVVQEPILVLIKLFKVIPDRLSGAVSQKKWTFDQPDQSHV